MKPIFAFIGGGNMGRALIGGLVAGGHAPAHIRVADSQPQSLAACRDRFGVGVFDDNRTCARGADVVVLAVKPQQLREVALELAADTNAATLYLSIAAGITTGHLHAWLGTQCAIVRCMPNTPALIGRGAAALFAGAAVSAPQRVLATTVLGAVGSVLWLDDESAMDAVTAVSGSGPAYFFLFIELIEKIGAELGLAPEHARALALQTALGAAELAHGSTSPPAELRRQVTSPGGTTERALERFAAAGLEDIVRTALTAARDRSIELAREVAL